MLKHTNLGHAGRVRLNGMSSIQWERLTSCYKPESSYTFPFDSSSFTRKSVKKLFSVHIGSSQLPFKLHSFCHHLKDLISKFQFLPSSHDASDVIVFSFAMHSCRFKCWLSLAGTCARIACVAVNPLDGRPAPASCSMSHYFLAFWWIGINNKRCMIECYDAAKRTRKLARSLFGKPC